jgi:hypothetical protein
MEAFNTICKDLCEYNEDTQVIDRYDGDTDTFIKICDVEVFENKRGAYIKIIANEQHLLLDEMDIDKIKSESLKLSLLSLIEEAEEMSRRFYEPEHDDRYQQFRENN